MGCLPTIPRKVSLFFTVFFVSLAAILGLVILSVPVRLYDCGLMPLIVCLVPALLAQSCVIVLMMELLQRAECIFALRKEMTQEMEDIGKDSGGAILPSSVSVSVARPSATQTPAKRAAGESDDEEVDIETSTHPVTKTGAPVSPTPRKDQDSARAAEPSSSSPAMDECDDAASVDSDQEPIEEVIEEAKKASELKEEADLHSLSVLFIRQRPLRWLYNAMVQIYFITLLVSYSIAASETISELITLSRITCIIFFVLFMTTCIIMFSNQLQPIVASLCLVKGSLLVGMIFVVLVSTSAIRVTPRTSYGAIADPFLLSTILISGAVNVMPVMYSKVNKESVEEIRLCRTAVLSSIVASFVLVIGWCGAILYSVPQHGPISLAQAHDESEICTIPLMRVMAAHSSSMYVLGVIIDIFIIVSVTVTYTALGLGFLHTLKGIVLSLPGRRRPEYFTLAYVIGFGIVLLIGIFFADNLFLVLESFTGISGALEAGLFFGFMYHTAQKKARKDPSYRVKHRVKVPLDEVWGWRMTYIVGVYFIFALLVNFAHLAREIYDSLVGSE